MAEVRELVPGYVWVTVLREIEASNTGEEIPRCKNADSSEAHVRANNHVPASNVDMHEFRKIERMTIGNQWFTGSCLYALNVDRQAYVPQYPLKN